MMRFLKKSRGGGSRAGVTGAGSRTRVALAAHSQDGAIRVAFSVRESAADSVDRRGSAGLDLPSGTAVTAVLGAADYRLRLLDLPGVPAAELREALRWQGRELIDIPAQDAIVDYMEVPTGAKRSGPAQGYAVFGRDATIRATAMELGGDRVDCVTVTEACLHNVARLLPNQQSGVALLYFADDCGFLLISRGGVLHQVRRLNAGTDRIATALGDDFSLQELANGLSLEIQRSLDYYESQYECNPIQEINVVPAADAGIVLELLQSSLGIRVAQVDIAEHIVIENIPDGTSIGEFVIALGAALDVPTTSDSADIKQGINLLPVTADSVQVGFSSRFLLQSIAAGIVVMTVIGAFASSRVESLREELEFSRKQEEIAARHLEDAGDVIRRAYGADARALQRESLELELRHKRNLLSLLKGQALGEGQGFSDQLATLAELDVDGLWFTRISLNADASQNRMAGLAFRAEVVPAYVQSLTASAAFEGHGFQALRIDSQDDPGTPLVFSMAGQADGLDDWGDE